MIEKIIHIAREAGEIIRDGYRQNINFEFKSTALDLVTETDRKSEKLIIDFIRREFPSHSILAEESGRVNNGFEYTWVIDPLDGTTNFKHGLPIFSVSIGLQRNGETICGVVYDIMSDKLYSAEKGSGSFENGRKLRVSETAEIKSGLLVTGFPYNIAENPENAVERFNHMLKIARGVRRLGSAAIDFCYLADGIFDGFWEVHLNPWDICGGKLIVEEAGGIVTDLDGNSINIDTPRILASNGKIHGEFITELAKF